MPDSPQTAVELLPCVSAQLRVRAEARMAAESVGHTLHPTAPVREAYLRLVGNADARRWAHRGHFFAVAVGATRKKADRRGDERGRADLLDVRAIRSDERLLALDEALTRLAAERDFRVIAYRFGNRNP